jgi:hypothetical protein
VKRPEQLSRCGIPAANVAVESQARRLLAVVAASNNDVLVDRRRRRQREPAIDVTADARLQIDRPAVAKSIDRFTSLHVDRQQPVAGTGEEPRR